MSTPPPTNSPAPKPRLKEVLLVDDSEADNFLNRRIIRRSGLVERIRVTYGAREALDYLSTAAADGDFPRPTLVFLDINMPGMSGWDFLEAYGELPPEQQAGVVICMITTSRAERDRRRAAEFGIVKDFSHKPLTEARFREIVARHFPEVAGA